MLRDYEKLFSRLKPPEPPGELFDRIMSRIRAERRLLTIRRRLTLFSAIIIASAVAFVPVYQMVQAGFAESGFNEFFSLIFSDTGIVMAYWQNFILSLLETLPIMNIILLLALALIFLETFKYLVKDIKIIINAKQLIKI